MGLVDKKVILFVGSLLKRKGVRVLLEAFQKVSTQFPNASLLWIGEGPLKSEVMKSKQSIPLGFIQPSELPTYYGLADFFVLPSLNEPFGAVVCEAASAGLPVITTSAVGASADFVLEGKTGFIVPPNDTEALAERISLLISNDSLQKSMSVAAIQLMKPWTDEFMAQQMITASKVAFS